jgi:formylglycine-generating enzyme required for sulfatase activity
MDEILHREPRPPRQLNDAVPREIEAVCLRCLAKRVVDRYSAAIDVVEDLRTYLRIESALGAPPETFVAANAVQIDRDPTAGTYDSKTPPPSTPESTVITAAKPRGRLWTRWTTIAAISLVSVGIAVWTAGHYGGAGNKRSPAGGAKTAEIGGAEPHGVPMPPHAKPVLRRVRLVTKPPNAQIVLYGFDPKYGLVDPAQAVRPAERTPLELELWSGEYFVVAVLDDGRFHEVYRHVPPEPSAMPVFPHNHTSWHVRDEGHVELYPINIPAASVTEEMAHFAGSREFEVGIKDDGTVPTHRRRVPPFYLDCREVTWRQYKQAFRQQPPSFMDQWRGAPLTDDQPAVMLFIDHALAHAEEVGKRLPWEVEYEFAATLGGTRPFPWGDGPGRITKWQFGPAGEPTFDRVDADRPVFGLFSNAAEWTGSWASPYPPRLDYQPKFPGRRPGEYVVRGGSMSVIQRQSDGRDWTLGPRMRIALGDRDYYPGLGFRCARSAKPHLNPEDFETILLP